MVNENKFAEIKLVPSTPKTETRIILNDWPQEVKKSPLSVAARNKVINRSGSNYLSENQGNYGPCRNSICGCYCTSETCTCKSASVWTVSAGAGVAASGRAWNETNNVGVGGQVGASMFSSRDSDYEFRALGVLAGGEAQVTQEKISLKAEVGVDAYNLKIDGIQAKVGPNISTGVSVSNSGVEFKILGVGFSISEDGIGISTPIASLSYTAKKEG